MGIVLVSSAIDHGMEPCLECHRSWDGALVYQTRVYKISICLVSSLEIISHAALRGKSKDWLAQDVVPFHHYYMGRGIIIFNKTPM